MGLGPERDLSECVPANGLTDWRQDGRAGLEPGEPRGPERQWQCPLSVLLAEVGSPEPAPCPRSGLGAPGAPEEEQRLPASWPRAGRSRVYLGRQTSFVTLTYCCQEPKNTFINGKTGMAPRRNILTSPEEPAGGFRAHPQEAWVSYLLGSPPEGKGRPLLPAGRLPRSRVGLQGMASWAGLCQVDFCEVSWTPCSRLLPHPGYCPTRVFSLLTISSDGQRKARSHLQASSRRSQAPTCACRERERPACPSSKLYGSGEGEGYPLPAVLTEPQAP